MGASASKSPGDSSAAHASPRGDWHHDPNFITVAQDGDAEGIDDADDAMRGEDGVRVAEKFGRRFRNESAEASVLRKLGALQTTKPVLAWRRKDAHEFAQWHHTHHQMHHHHHDQMRHPPGDDESASSTPVATPSSSTPLASPSHPLLMSKLDVAPALDASLRDAMRDVSQWYSTQAGMATHRQFQLHEEMAQVDALVKMAWRTLERERKGIAKFATEDVDAMEGIERELDTLRKCVEEAFRAQSQIVEAFDIAMDLRKLEKENQSQPDEQKPN